MELRSEANPIGSRVRRKGSGSKSAITLQPELPGAVEALITDAIRGDPATALRWISRSQRRIPRALCEHGSAVSCYPKGIKGTDAEMAAHAIECDAFYGEWNYTISSTQQPP